MLARARGVCALAAAISIGLVAGAGAAPADREGDPVVLTGDDLPALKGTSPDRIVGFKWDGKWTQVPVQVDERHTIDVRQLYPYDPAPGYVGWSRTAFPLEVYADAKTRSGADSDPTFDGDDELVFMGGDAGRQARAGVTLPPAGVDPASGRAVTVTDDDGGKGYVYLFRSNGSLDPGAGRSYVDYDFKLTRLTEGQTMLDHYGYSNSNNPEDSTVKTPYYTLHSTDRWMEDRMEIHAGSADGTDILDREVAQATLASCGRSELTFSGNWDRGGDQDEGTYVAVTDGPVRAVRSYMGANSGPYVQRDHIYYSQREDNTVYLRVHIMADLYTWTDYSEAAVGMTYRDARNPGGVTVDGVPDTLTPTELGDFADGRRVWQQLSGPQGSVTTVTSAETDIPNPNLGNYYLDDETPDGPRERQCGGDGKSFGASGFGILGPVTPNTDPRVEPYNRLEVKRVRYFGAPEAGAAEAADLARRVDRPLVATDSEFKPGKAARKSPRLRLKPAGRRPVAKRGRTLRVRAVLANRGDARAQRIRVCVRPNRSVRRAGCKVIRSLPAGRSRKVAFRVRVKPRARGKKLTLRLTAKAKGVKAARAVARFRLR